VKKQMRFRIVEIEAGQALSRSGLPDIDYALNPYLGCSHGCLYCYAKAYTRYRDAAENWGRVVAVKKNIVEVLRREVRQVKKGTVGIGTITDPYQPVEALYNLTRACIEVLVRSGFRVSIQTKSSLVLRDLDVLKSNRELVDVGLTITSTKNSSAMRLLEPYSSPPQARVEALKKLSSEGITTWIFYGPVIPGYNDSIEEVIEVLRLAKDTHSTVYIDRFRVKKTMFRDPALSSIIRKSSRYDWKEFFRSVLELCKDMNVVCLTGLGEPGNKLSKSIKLDHFL